LILIEHNLCLQEPILVSIRCLTAIFILFAGTTRTKMIHFPSPFGCVPLFSCSSRLTWFKMPSTPANRFTIFFSTVNEISCEIVDAVKIFVFFLCGSPRGGFFKPVEKCLGAVICIPSRGMARLMDWPLLLFFGLGLRQKGQCGLFGPVRFVDQNFPRRI